jgi:hypothetical protein
VQEAELVELVVLRLPGSRLDLAFRCGHEGHDTSVEAESAPEGCGSDARAWRNGSGGTERRRGAAA